MHWRCGPGIVYCSEMKCSVSTVFPFLVFKLVAAAWVPAMAALPTLQERPWLGHFFGIESRDFIFKVDQEGAGRLTLIDDKKKEFGHAMDIQVNIVMEEVQPGGKVTARKVRVDSLATDDEPGSEGAAVKFTGQTTGEAKFEVTMSATKNEIALGIRLLEPGTLKNPQPVIRVNLPNVYQSVSAAKKDERTFERRIKGDRLQVVALDGEKSKIPTGEPLDASKLETSKGGLKEVDVELDGFRGRELRFSGEGKGKIMLWNSSTQPLNKGFGVNWLPDSDAAEDALLRIRVK